MMKRKTVFMRSVLLVLVSIWILLPAACGESLQSGDGKTIGEQIAAIDGVFSVEPIGNNQSEWLPEKYLVLVEQQLDWNNPEAGTILQRVEVGIHPGAQVNLLETYGYTFRDGDFSADNQPEIVVLLEANHIKAEHRLAGESFPEGMNNRSTEGWEYLTTENEAGDYHHIYEIMSQVLEGPWVSYGRSRGGRACADYARYYPGDMKGYIPYVGVNPSSINDPRIMDYINMKIGDAAFGKEEAARRRGVMEDFLAECVKNRDPLENLLWDNMTENGCSFPEWVTRERLFDISLLEFQTGFWQDYGDLQETEEALDSFAKTTDENFVFIGGDLDPWSVIYIDSGDNPHFKSYILTGKSHQTQISDFDPETQTEILETIKSWYQNE